MTNIAHHPPPSIGLSWGLYYASQGLPVFPIWWIESDGRCACGRGACTSPGKHPMTLRGHHDATTDPLAVHKWWTEIPQANIGIAIPDGLIVVDIDPRNGGTESIARLESERGSFPVTRSAFTGSGGMHLWFRVPAGLQFPAKLADGIDIKARGGYVLAPPSNHASGRVYEWEDPSTPIVDSPAWLVDLGRPRGEARRVERELMGLSDDLDHAAIAELIAPYFVRGTRHDLALAIGGYLANQGYSEDDAEEIVGQLPSEDPEARIRDARAAFRYERPAGFSRIRETLTATVGEAEAARALADLERLCPETAAGYRARVDATNAVLLAPALEAGASGAAAAANDATEATAAVGWLPLDDRGLQGRFCRCDDIGNGERLLLRFGHGLRYVHARRKWLIWSAAAGCWQWDDGPLIDRLAQYTARQIHVEAASAGDDDAAKALSAWANKSADAYRRQAMIRSASSHCAIDATDLDRDPGLLNCANGTLDLRTGELRPHDPRDLITRSTRIAYDPKAQHEVWSRVIDTATGGDAEMRAFLQRLAGYCTSGFVTEKHFFFIYSKMHDTAKSTVCDAFRGALGEYAMAADFGTWLEQPNGGNRGDIVRLMGARLIVSVEVEENAKFNAKLLKAWTGGDEITAAAKYEADVSFRPTGKIVLAANAAPKIRHSDKPLFERCVRIPFDVQIPKSQQDKRIKVRLLHDDAVRRAVLAWMVAGFSEWQRRGLAPPARVVESSRSYRVEADWVAAFLRERCELVPDAETPRLALRSAIVNWFNERGLRPPSATNDELAERLAEYGVSLRVVRGARAWRGVRLLPLE